MPEDLKVIAHSQRGGARSRAAHSHSGQTPLIPETAQHSEAKEEMRGKYCRYRHGAYGQSLRDSIRRKNFAHGFEAEASVRC